MGYRDGRYCCECDLCPAGPCNRSQGIHTLWLTDDPDHEYTLFCTAHAAIVVEKTRAHLADHPGVAVDPECADAWAAALEAAGEE